LREKIVSKNKREKVTEKNQTINQQFFYFLDGILIREIIKKMQELWKNIRINFWGGTNMVYEIFVKGNKWTEEDYIKEIEVIISDKIYSNMY